MTINFPEWVKVSKCKMHSRTGFWDTSHGKIKLVVRIENR